MHIQIAELLTQEVSYTEAKEIVAKRNDGTRLPTSEEAQNLTFTQIPRGCWVESGDSPEEEFYMNVPECGVTYLQREWSGRVKKPILLVV